MKTLVSKAAHSVMARLALIVAALGVMIGAAVYVSWTVFQSIEVEMLTLVDSRLPQLRASADVTTATDDTRGLLSETLSATTLGQLDDLIVVKPDVISNFRTVIQSLPPENRDTTAALLDEAELALRALLAARQEELRAATDALSTLETAFQSATSVSSGLEEATDTAVFDMTLSGEEAISSIDETLSSLVERDFLQFQVVLAIQSEVNLLSGLGLAIQAGGAAATRAIIDDLAVSSLERLETSLGTARGIVALDDVSTSVASAIDFFRGAFANSIRPPSPSEILATRLDVDGVLSPAVDDAYFNLVIGSEGAKDTSSAALTNLIENEVTAMREASALDAATKNFFSLALKTALAQSQTELSLVQGELLAQETIVRSLMTQVTEERILADIDKLLAVADAEEGIAAKQSAVFSAQAAAREAATVATQSVGAIASETAAFSAASVDSIDETAGVLTARVENAGAQILQIGAAGLVMVLIAPMFVWVLVTRPLNRVTAATERLAKGDLSELAGLRQSEGELGRLATALRVFRENARQTIALREQEKKREVEAREKEKADQEAKRAAAELEEKRKKEREEQARLETEGARREMVANLNASIGAVVSAASKGDFSTRVEVVFEDKELAGLASSVNALVESVETGLKATTEVLSRVAEGDLTKGMSGEFHGDFARLKNGTNSMIDALRTLVSEISGSGNNLASSSAELRDTSDSLSRQAEQNAASLEETSAALEELSASIKQVSGSAEEASESARVASSTAQSSGEVAADAAASMARISDASKEIAQAVGVINDIAFQINLLALNAGVEAARAGDAGRGFSVVASEVRQLAQRASEAAKEIDTVIGRSDDAVTEGVAKVGNAQTSLASISESVVNISSRVEDISRAIHEQVHGVSEITNAVSQIDQNTQKQAASFEEVTAAGSVLASEAEGLRRSTARFTIDDQNKILQMTERPMKTVKPVQVTARVSPASGTVRSASTGDGWDEF